MIQLTMITAILPYLSLASHHSMASINKICVRNVPLSRLLVDRFRSQAAYFFGVDLVCLMLNSVMSSAWRPSYKPCDARVKNDIDEWIILVDNKEAYGLIMFCFSYAFRYDRRVIDAN